MTEEKIVWVYWREEVEAYVCEHQQAATLMRLLMTVACTPEAMLGVVFGDDAPTFAIKPSMKEVVEMLNLPLPDDDHEHEIALEVINDKRFAVCRDCLIKIVFEEQGRWAVVTRDTGEVLRMGDQNIDEAKLRWLVQAELGEKEKELRRSS